MIPKAVRSQGSFQYDPYPIHVYLWFELSLHFGKLYIQILRILHQVRELALSTYIY